MALVVTHVLSVCDRCMFTAVNGDDIDPDHGCEPWSKAPAGHACMGVDEHHDTCTEEDRDFGGCYCDSLGFRQSSCDACGCALHGDRHSFVILGEENAA